MKVVNIPYQKTKKFTHLINDYLSRSDNLQNFYNRYPTLENFSAQWEEKSKYKIDRKLLVKVLNDQNQLLTLSSSTRYNIDSLLKKDSFTVTTGHQLCLFTGPLYFIYKIISTINLVEMLKEKYPEKNFIPVFWMASEDHDFQEVNHIHLFGKKIEWNSGQKGAVGRMSLEGIEAVLDDLDKLLGDGVNAKHLSNIFRDAYLKHNRLADASRFLVNALFGKFGLVILDGDDNRLKQQFISIVKKDVLHQGFFKTISKCSQNLAKEYKTQAFVRDINFFYLSERGRKRLEGGVLECEIDSNPEDYSPNVLMRPLYQEIVLPNLAYVGGGAEVAYWMQLKTAFDQEQIPFPILVIRNSMLWVEQKQLNKWQNLGFDLADLFLDEHQLHQKYVSWQTNLNLTEEFKILNKVFEQILSKINDKGLQKSVVAEQQRQLNSFKKLEKKLYKSEKKKHDDALNQITNIKAKLFPNNSLQERYDNFITFYLKHGDNFIEILKKELIPLDAKFVILSPQ